MSTYAAQRAQMRASDGDVDAVLTAIEQRLTKVAHRLAAIAPEPVSQAVAEPAVAQPVQSIAAEPAEQARVARPRFARLVRGVWIAGIVAGVLLVADGLATIFWQEPITAIYTSIQQDQLASRLPKTDHLPGMSVAGAAARLARTTNAGDPIGRVEIPSLQTQFIFVQGTGTDSLRLGPGHYASTALPGESGSVGIAGHRTTYLAPFRNIDQLHRGSPIVLVMPYGRFTYWVTGSALVNPAHSAVLRATTGQRLVLTTCDPVFSDARRLVVFARLVDTRPA